MKTLSKHKRNMPPIYSPPVVAPSGSARSECHELLAFENSGGDRAELHSPPAPVIGDDVSDPTHELPVVMIGNGEYRRAIHADGVGVLWKDMLILAAVIVGVALFVLLIGG